MALSLKRQLVALLIKRKETISTAESCTGGMIAAAITDVPGASNVFAGSIIAYADAVKTDLLAVSSATLKKYGAVSEEAALEMAKNARALFKTTWAISVTGIAGPGGGSKEKPVGTVFIGICGPQLVSAQKLFIHETGRKKKRVRAVDEALKLLLKAISQLKP